MPTSKPVASRRSGLCVVGLQMTLLAGLAGLAACDRPVRAHILPPQPATPVVVSTSERAPTPPKPLRHRALPIVPPPSEAFATLMAEDPSPLALSRLRRHLLGERLYCDFLETHRPEKVPKLDQITKSLSGLRDLPDLANRAEKLLTQARQLAERDGDHEILGQATHRLLTQTERSLHLLELALAPAIDALRGPILRRIDAKILTARKVEEASFAPIAHQLQILRDRIQHMGDLLDSQRAFLKTRATQLSSTLSTPPLFQPDSLAEAQTLANSVVAQLHRSLVPR